MNEKKINEELKADEKLIWSDAPEGFTTFDKTHKSSLLIAIIVPLVIAVALTLWYILSAEVVDAMILILILMFAVMLVIPKLAAASVLEHDVCYALTDKRFFSYTSSSAVTSVPLNTIKDYEFKTDSDGHYYFVCGEKALGLGVEKLRDRATNDSVINKDVCTSYVMYGITKIDELKQALKLCEI